MSLDRGSQFTRFPDIYIQRAWEAQVVLNRVSRYVQLFSTREVGLSFPLIDDRSPLSLPRSRCWLYNAFHLFPAYQRLCAT